MSASTALALTPIELTPTDVGSSNSAVFSTLPTVDPALFGLTGADVRGVNFDFNTKDLPITNGTALTNLYEPLGVLMNGITVSSGVYGGAASAPNATFFDQGHIFTFTVPVVAVGIINTSPDQDRVRFYSGPDATGDLLFDFTDQQGMPRNFNVDRFVGGRIEDGDPFIGSFVVTNEAGNLELDELIFEVGEVPAPGSLICIVGLLATARQRRRRMH